ncbi:MAG TPA: hypothetical protein ENI92_01045 [Bacteroidetes bacterium]|nr:hypothetical protein [Bacteroidota bacterium]
MPEPEAEGEEAEKAARDVGGPIDADWGDEEETPQADTISEPKMKKIEMMHKQGSSVREIAETLGMGQDEVKMVLRLVDTV